MRKLSPKRQNQIYISYSKCAGTDNNVNTHVTANTIQADSVVSVLLIHILIPENMQIVYGMLIVYILPVVFVSCAIFIHILQGYVILTIVPLLVK